MLDGSDPTIAATSLSAAQLIAQAHATEVMTERLARTGQGVAVGMEKEVIKEVQKAVDNAGLHVTSIRSASPDLEDVFVDLLEQ